MFASFLVMYCGREIWSIGSAGNLTFICAPHNPISPHLPSLLPSAPNPKQKKATHDIAPRTNHPTNIRPPLDNTQSVPRRALESRDVAVVRTGDDGDAAPKVFLDAREEVLRGGETADEDDGVGGVDFGELVFEEGEDLGCGGRDGGEMGKEGEGVKCGWKGEEDRGEERVGGRESGSAVRRRRRQVRE